ncbi:MAG: NAD(P)/FAD-dependent oxidoreductase [Anaerolineae bacterium]|nr:NAD(P)/FAD-dependent oxidoreductase [Anaerolineae bacterium]
MNEKQADLPRVVVVGAGFGGLRVAKQLVRQPVDVTLVDQNNFHTFQPLLYQVATAALEPEGIVYPVRAIFRAPNIHFRLARVERIDLAARQILTNTGPLPYDYLVLAAGSVTNFFGSQEIERHAFGLKDLHEAETLRSHLLTMFERASVTTDPQEHQTLLTFVIVGGGPTGVEMAGSLTELIHQNLVRDYPRLDVQSARVILLEAADSLLGAFPPKLRENALKQLRRKGVEVRLGAMVAGADENEVRLKDGTVIPTHTLFWAAGVRAADLAQELGQPTGRGGRVKVTPTLQLEAAPNVFVIGDMAYLEQAGQPLPQVAPVAIQMGEQTAANILRHLRGETLQPFRYKDPGSMATIGRSAAVAQVAGLQFTGFTAWVVWLFIHLIQLIGFRNRLIVLVNWAWNYLLADRGVRLITTPPPAAEVDHREQATG